MQNPNTNEKIECYWHEAADLHKKGWVIVECDWVDPYDEGILVDEY
jgi:hypothetical protein